MQAHARGGLVHEVDGFVGQEAIGDIAIAEASRCVERLVADLYPMMCFVAVAQTLEDLDGLLHCRLANHDRLEAALERRVLFDVLTKFVERGGADALEFASRQCRLDDVAGVDCAFSCTRSDERVQFVDEKMISPEAPRISSMTRFMRSSNSPRYLVPATRPARSSVMTRLSRKGSGTSPLITRCAKPSAMAVLPTPGSPISAGLFLVRRERIWITRSISVLRPITGSSLLSRASWVRSRPYASSVGVLLLPLLVLCDLCFRSEQRGSLHANLGWVDAQICEDAGSDAFAFANETQQQVLGADVVMVELARFFESEFDDALGSRGKHHLLLDSLPASTDNRLNFRANLRQVDS